MCVCVCVCVFSIFQKFLIGVDRIHEYSEWLSCAFTALSKQFQSYQADVRVIIKGVRNQPIHH